MTGKGYECEKETKRNHTFVQKSIDRRSKYARVYSSEGVADAAGHDADRQHGKENPVCVLHRKTHAHVCCV